MGGDLILEMGEQEAYHAACLVESASRIRSQNQIRVKLLRGGKEMEVMLDVSATRKNFLHRRDGSKKTDNLFETDVCTTQRSKALANVPLGAFANATYDQERIQLYAGDQLLVHTDGLTEASNSADGEFADNRLRPF